MTRRRLIITSPPPGLPGIQGLLPLVCLCQQRRVRRTPVNPPPAPTNSSSSSAQQVSGPCARRGRGGEGMGEEVRERVSCAGGEHTHHRVGAANGGRACQGRGGGWRVCQGAVLLKTRRICCLSSLPVQRGRYDWGGSHESHPSQRPLLLNGGRAPVQRGQRPNGHAASPAEYAAVGPTRSKTARASRGCLQGAGGWERGETRGLARQRLTRARAHTAVGAQGPREAAAARVSLKKLGCCESPRGGAALLLSTAAPRKG